MLRITEFPVGFKELVLQEVFRGVSVPLVRLVGVVLSQQSQQGSGGAGQRRRGRPAKHGRRTWQGMYKRIEGNEFEYFLSGDQREGLVRYQREGLEHDQREGLERDQREGLECDQREELDRDQREELDELQRD
ncbi:hypothetical protein EMCRGX_G027830 [Ephydatia muelleri]